MRSKERLLLKTMMTVATNARLIGTPCPPGRRMKVTKILLLLLLHRRAWHDVGCKWKCNGKCKRRPPNVSLKSLRRADLRPAPTAMPRAGLLVAFVTARRSCASLPPRRHKRRTSSPWVCPRPLRQPPRRRASRNSFCRPRSFAPARFANRGWKRVNPVKARDGLPPGRSCRINWSASMTRMTLPCRRGCNVGPYASFFLIQPA